MKYPYTIEYYTIGTHRYPVMIVPQEIKLVTAFLASDVQRFTGRDLFMESIDFVLQGKAPCREVQGNIHKLEIRRDTTRIIDTLAEEERSNIIETEELKQLMEVWYEIIKKKEI